jgi:polar amino acid transport system substrate-binding protein
MGAVFSVDSFAIAQYVLCGRHLASCCAGHCAVRLPDSVAAGAGPDGPDCSRPYTLGLHDHGLLYSAATDTGIDKDFADELIRRSGCKVNVSLMSRARIWQLIESGALDFSLGHHQSGAGQVCRLRLVLQQQVLPAGAQGCRHHPPGRCQPQRTLPAGRIRSFRYSANANRMVDQLSAANRVSQAGGLEPLYDALLLNHPGHDYGTLRLPGGRGKAHP